VELIPAQALLAVEWLGRNTSVAQGAVVLRKGASPVFRSFSVAKLSCSIPSSNRLLPQSLLWQSGAMQGLAPKLLPFAGRGNQSLERPYAILLLTKPFCAELPDVPKLKAGVEGNKSTVVVRHLSLSVKS
jgi:hypothetical protein